MVRFINPDPATEPRRFATWLIRSLSSNPWKFPCGYRPRTHGTRDSGVGDSTFRNRRASSRDRSRTAREADANCGGIVVSTSLQADRCFGRGTHAWEWAMGPIHGLPPPPTQTMGIHQKRVRLPAGGFGYCSGLANISLATSERHYTECLLMSHLSPRMASQVSGMNFK